MNEKKVCTKCQELKSEICFPSRKSSSDGLDSWCRSCGAEASRARSRKKAKHSISRAFVLSPNGSNSNDL